MKKLIFATATACLLLASCSGDKQANDGFVVLDIVGNMDADNTDNFDEIADVKMMFHPELTDSTQIGGFSIRGIIDNRFYVYYNRMMIFDQNGKCISSFDRSGGGPGEYQYPWIKWGAPYNGDWMVYEPAIVNKNHRNVIFSYSASGSFIGNDTIKQMFLNRDLLVPYKKEGWIAAVVQNGKDIKIEKYDTAWNLTDTIITPFVADEITSVRDSKYKWVVQPSLPVSTSQNYILYKDTVYEPDFTASKLTPKIALRLGDFKTPDNYCPYDSTGDYINPAVYLTQRHALVTYNHNDECVVQFYDRSNGELVASFRTPYDPKERAYRGVMMKCAGEEIKLRPLDYTTDDTFFFNADSETMSEITGDMEANPAMYSVKLK